MEASFDTYYKEVKDHIHLYFFKMLDDGPSCVSQTSDVKDQELLIKMAISRSREYIADQKKKEIGSVDLKG